MRWYASRGICYGNSVCVPVCVCLCALYQNGCMDRADFLHAGFLRPMTQCILRKLGYFQNKVNSLWNFVPKSVLATVCRQLVSKIFSNSGRSAVDGTALGGVQYRPTTTLRLFVACGVALCRAPVNFVMRVRSVWANNTCNLTIITYGISVGCGFVPQTQQCKSVATVFVEGGRWCYTVAIFDRCSSCCTQDNHWSFSKSGHLVCLNGAPSLIA